MKIKWHRVTIEELDFIEACLNVNLSFVKDARECNTEGSHGDGSLKFTCEAESMSLSMTNGMTGVSTLPTGVRKCD